ncbi:MAG: hypothetical protein JRL30_00980 [Deltaproteobacteria bacterium]|nr:hypothetical protein [Deltaproteobacteria bacterium]
MRKKTIRAEIHRGPDGTGRYFYTLFWTDDQGKERGQCFNMSLDQEKNEEVRAAIEAAISNR